VCRSARFTLGHELPRTRVVSSTCSKGPFSSQLWDERTIDTGTGWEAPDGVPLSPPSLRLNVTGEDVPHVL
jgi:hypothetical protein